jgi:hypothetical protein
VFRKFDVTVQGESFTEYDDLGTISMDSQLAMPLSAKNSNIKPLETH